MESKPPGTAAAAGVRKHLSNRFQLAVDAVATATGRTEEQAYLAGWSWGEPVEETGEPRLVAERVVERLEADYPPQRLRELRRSIIAGHERGLNHRETPLTPRHRPLPATRTRNGP